MLLRTEKHRRVYFPISHIGLEMTAESLKLLLQLPHQRDAVVGNLPDVLSDEKRRHRRAVFERPLFSDPIFCIAKVHSQWKSKSRKIHQKFSSRKIDDYLVLIYRQFHFIVLRLPCR